MENKQKKNCSINITLKGPYIVSGNVPLFEKIIVPKGKSYEFKDGRVFPQAEEYRLCRCGKSANAPFCDGSHVKAGFSGEETATKDNYMDRAERIEGPGIDLLDDHRCAFVRFCHRQKGDTWELTEKSEDEENKNEVIVSAMECPSGRLTAADKDGRIFEPEYEPAIEIIQDPEANVSGGIFVKGNIPIISADGQTYEPRSRAVLCRCGNSGNKPFCDSSHFLTGFKDKQ